VYRAAGRFRGTERSEVPPFSPTFFNERCANNESAPEAEKGGPEKSGETGLRILRNYVDYCVDQR